MKKYRLLKDLPGQPAGTIGEMMGEQVLFGPLWYSEYFVKQHPEWFELVTERPPLGIIPEWRWKELRLQEIDEAIDRYTSEGKPISTDWVIEKMLLKEWLENWEENKKPPQKEHIEVSNVGRHNLCSHLNVWQFKTSKEISKDQFPAIKKAIEDCLNHSGKVYDEYNSPPLYTEQKLNQAEEKAWNAARQQNQHAMYSPCLYYYPELKDYKNAKTQAQ